GPTATRTTSSWSRSSGQTAKVALGGSGSADRASRITGSAAHASRSSCARRGSARSPGAPGGHHTHAGYEMRAEDGSGSRPRLLTLRARSYEGRRPWSGGGVKGG